MTCSVLTVHITDSNIMSPQSSQAALFTPLLAWQGPADCVSSEIAYVLLWILLD